MGVEITTEIKQKTMVAAKAFYDDCKNDKDYPHKDVSDQYEEFINMLRTGGVSLDFIETCYEWNK